MEDILGKKRNTHPLLLLSSDTITTFPEVEPTICTQEKDDESENVPPATTKILTTPKTAYRNKKILEMIEKNIIRNI